ncbi:hypothetical protein EBU94_07895, partial [bacterium]|nr:hypothetical protein [bacterium]
MFTFLLGGYVPFISIAKQLAKEVNCEQSDPEYKKFISKAKTMYDNEFSADEIDYLSAEKTALAAFKLYGRDIEKKELMDDFEKIFFNIS